MEKLKLEFEIAYNLLKESIGKHYRIYSSSFSGGADFSINSGIVESVEQDYEFGLLVVKLEGHDNIERFTLNSLREIKTVEKENYTMIQPIYDDGSYFKVYITENGGV